MTGCYRVFTTTAPRRSVCAPAAVDFNLQQTRKEMDDESTFLQQSVRRSSGGPQHDERHPPYDFNNDGLADLVELTNATTITVSLNNGDGSYSVSATLTIPKNRPIGEIFVGDYNNDGNLDISGGGGLNAKFYTNVWLGEGDGTFGHRHTVNSHPNTHGGF